MKLIKSYTPDEAYSLGFLQVDHSATIADGVRLVLFEDDGTSAGPIQIGSGTIIREGSIICSGVKIDSDTVIGHNVVIRRNVQIGRETVISHMVCLERDSRIGSNVRISSLTHITGECLIEDDVQVGARVVTINDNQLKWGENPKLVAPILRKGCRIGSGVTLLSGVEIGTRTLVGAGSVVTKSLPANVVAYGIPAYIQRELPEKE